jgi:hypothetical protein
MRAPPGSGPTIGREAMNRIGRGLRTIYAEAPVPPLPDRICAALNALSERDTCAERLSKAARWMLVAEAASPAAGPTAGGIARPSRSAPAVVAAIASPGRFGRR